MARNSNECDSFRRMKRRSDKICIRWMNACIEYLLAVSSSNKDKSIKD